MDSTTLKALIDSQITNETLPNSISPTDVGGNLKAVVDFAEQQAPTKISGSVTLNAATYTSLPNDSNLCAFTGGKALLPVTTMIGKQVIVVAQDDITVRAYADSAAKLFDVYGSFTSNAAMTANQTFRFTYVGFGTGTGGVTNGYWKSEQI